MSSLIASAILLRMLTVKSTFTIGEEDASGAIEILVKGDSMGSNYKILAVQKSVR